MLKIFIDFDGTITKKDVGDALFIHFGGNQCIDFIEEYRQGRTSAIECFRKECIACGSIDKKELDNFIDSQEIDETFKDFKLFCKNNNIEIFILSDGMDYYIDEILKNNNITDVPVYTNQLQLESLDGSSKFILKPIFPFTDENCDRCACCKRNHMLVLSADDDIIIYIGEGYSDRCPVRYADLVFAKDDLLKYCQQENISYFEYHSFADVTDRLKMLLGNKNTKKNYGLKKRRQAQLAAREVFLGG